MAKSVELEKLTGLASRFGAFIAERHPLALNDALDAFDKAAAGRDPKGEKAIEALRPTLQRELKKRLLARALPPGLPDTTPRTTAAARLNQAYAELLDAADGFLRRAAIAESLTKEERLEILRGMVLTRATDNRLKTFFTGRRNQGTVPPRFRARDSARSDRRRSTPRRSACAGERRTGGPMD